MLLEFVPKRLHVNLIIGVALVISLIATPLWVGEYVADAQLQMNFSRVLVDARMSIRLTNFVNDLSLKRDISSLSFVRDVKLIEYRAERSIILKFSSGWELYPMHNGSKSLLLLSFNSSEWINNYEFISGNYPESSDEVAVTVDLAKRFSINVGDTVNISSPWIQFEKSYRVCGIFNVSGLLARILYGEDLIKSDIPVEVKNETINYWGALLFTRREVISGEGLSSAYSALPYYYIWINREEIFNPWLPSQMLKKLKSFDDQIVLRATKYTPMVTITYFNYLAMAIKTYSGWPSAFKIQLTYAILPGFLVGSFLAIIVGWTFINRRKHEIALFKIRGLDKKQIAYLITYEFIIVSFLGSFLGFLFSILLVLVSAIILFPDYLAIYPIYKPLLSNFLNYLQLSIIYGLIFGFLSIAPTTAQAIKTTILEGLNPYLEKLEKETKPIYSFLAVAVGIYTLIESFSGLYVLKNIAMRLMSANTALIQITGVIIFVIDIIAIGTGSFALAYGLSRIIAYYASRIHGLLEGIITRLSSSFSAIAIKHFSRRPARTARLIFITALIISFMLSAGIDASSNVNEMTSLVKLMVGTNYRVDVFSGPRNPLFWEVNVTQDIKAISSQIDVITVYYGYKPITLGLPYARIIAVDPSYFKCAFLSDSIIHGVSLNDLRGGAFNSSTALLGVSARDDYGFRIGDVISFRFSYMGAREKVTFKVIGFMDFMPGLLNDIYEAQKTNEIVMIVSKNALIKYMDKPDRILIHVPDSIDTDSFINELSSVLLRNSVFAHIYSYRKVMDYVLRESITGIMINIYRAEFIQLAIITAFSIYLVLSTEYIERRREMALMLSRGVSRKQLYSIAKTEALIIILAAFITGFIISWGFAYPLLEMVSYGLFGPLKALPGHGIIISLDILIILISEAIIVYLSTILAMRVALRIDLPKEIRIYR